MRLQASIHLSLLVAGTLACELKVVPGDTDSGDAGTEGSSDGGSTEGGTEGGSVSSASVSSGSASATSSSSSAGSSVSTTEATVGSSSATSATTGVTTEATSNPTGMTSGAPVEPVPCAGPAKPIVAQTLAVTQSQIPPDPDPTGGSVATTGGDPLHPDTLHVRLSNVAAECKNPDPFPTCGPNWEVSIVIPPEFQTPGIYHLLGPEVTGHAFETGPDQGGGECSFGGGSLSATFELIAIDAQQIHGRLCHVDALFFDNTVDLEGSFTAPRCP